MTDGRILRDKVDEAVSWIQKAEVFYGMTNPRTAKVRRFFMAIVQPDDFEPVEVPEELKALGYGEKA